MTGSPLCNNVCVHLWSPGAIADDAGHQGQTSASCLILASRCLNLNDVFLNIWSKMVCGNYQSILILIYNAACCYAWKT